VRFVYTSQRQSALKVIGYVFYVLQIYVRPNLEHTLVPTRDGRFTLRAEQLMNAAADGLLLEIQEGWPWRHDICPSGLRTRSGANSKWPLHVASGEADERSR